ncbi:PREDICTED: sialic acid-binding Ig-like lectin 5 [Chinchilla lanigera]|uniref:sialic acid-binding Ig-like lectin 5 n=1 Tax=Chinchilla lanigera TaxID=34839 RepID=UPI0006982236|nr:PREDICTED: sialic acid-binding Ig-like lectin 5 [Chinchilla lanigera]
MLSLLLLSLLWAGSLQQDQQLKLQVQEKVTVQEGLCVLVPCSFSYAWGRWSSPAQFYMSWHRVKYSPYYGELVATNNPRLVLKTEIKGRFHLLGDIWTENCSLSIRGAQKEDAGNYVFRIERKNGGKNVYGDKPVHLQVTALTEKPALHIPEPLQSGRLIRLSCSLPGSCQQGPPLTFSWSGDALHSMDPWSLNSSELLLTPRPQDHNSNLTCRVKLGGSQVTTERTIRLNVSYAPHNLSISLLFRNDTVPQILQNASSLSILEGQPLQLTCNVDSYPPAQLSWFWESPDLNVSLISNARALELPHVGTAERGNFTCRAQNDLGSRNASVSLSVYYAPKLLGPWCSWEAAGLDCSCSSHAWPAPFLRWRLGERLLEGNSSSASFTVTSSSAGFWANSSLSLHGGLNSSLRLSCESRNVRGAQSVTVVLLPGKSEPWAGAMVGALGGAGAMALLCLCLCLILFCIMKARRTQAAGKSKRMDDEDPVMDTATWAFKKPWPDSPQTQAPPAGDALPHREQQELHYASLNFREMKLCEVKSRETQNCEAASSTEYSEIKTS